MARRLVLWMCLLLGAGTFAQNITVTYSQVFGAHSATGENPFVAAEPWSRDLPNLQGPATHNNIDTFPQGTVSQSCYASGYGVLSQTLWFLSGELESSVTATDNGQGDQNFRVGGLARGIYYNEFRVTQAATLILLSHGNASSSGAATGEVTVELDGSFLYIGPADYEIVKTISSGKHTLTIDASSSAEGYYNGPLTGRAHAFTHYQFSVHCPQISMSKTLTGAVQLSGLESSANRVVKLQVWQNGSLMQATQDRLNASGTYSVQTFISGDADVVVQVDGWLARRMSAVQFSGSTVNVPTANLVNGDLGGDNAVTVYDYSILSEYFDWNDQMPGWDIIGPNGSRPSDADMDGDGAVTIFDYSLLSDSFDLSGDA